MCAHRIALCTATHAPHPQMEQSFKMQVTMGMSQDGESDELKRVFLEGNPYLLVGPGGWGLGAATWGLG